MVKKIKDKITLFYFILFFLLIMKFGGSDPCSPHFSASPIVLTLHVLLSLLWVLVYLVVSSLASFLAVRFFAFFAPALFLISTVWYSIVLALYCTGAKQIPSSSVFLLSIDFDITRFKFVL